MLSLAKKIVQLRKERNLTQKELASIVGVHFSHMSRYERGISLPSIDVVKNLPKCSMSLLITCSLMIVRPWCGLASLTRNSCSNSSVFPA